jgi:AcrR family transcriptional regulator
MSELGTKEKILNAAEHLFARDGFHNASLRIITEEAGVNLAAVNYHFNSKESLLHAVIERRLLPLNQIRRERLEQVRDEAVKKGEKPRARDVMKAFLEPTLRFRDSEPGAKDLIALMGRAVSEPDDTIRSAFFKLVWPLFMLLYEVLSQALPELPENVFFWRLIFSMGAMNFIMQIPQIKFPENQKFINIIDETDTDSLIEMITGYVTSGLEGS